jgi:hypothetical protein
LCRNTPPDEWSICATIGRQSARHAAASAAVPEEQLRSQLNAVLNEMHAAVEAARAAAQRLPLADAADRGPHGLTLSTADRCAALAAPLRARQRPRAAAVSERSAQLHVAAVSERSAQLHVGAHFFEVRRAESDRRVVNVKVHAGHLHLLGHVVAGKVEHEARVHAREPMLPRLDAVFV